MREGVHAVSALSSRDASLLARDVDVRPYRQAFVLMVDGAITRGDVVTAVEDRLADVPRFRQIVTGWPMPRWADDPGFDVRGHVRETTLPEGQPIESWLEHRLGMASDRDHPLWQLWLVRLPAARTAAVMLAHPALANETDLLAALLGASDLAAPDADETVGAHRLRDVAGGAVVGPAFAAAEAAVTGLGGMLDSAWRTVGTKEATYHVAGVDVPLDDVRQVAQATGCGTREVALAIIAGGLRQRLAGDGRDALTLVAAPGASQVLTLPVDDAEPLRGLIAVASMMETWDQGAAPVLAASTAQAAAAREVVGAMPHTVLVTGPVAAADDGRVAGARVSGMTVFTTPTDDEEVAVSATTRGECLSLGVTSIVPLDGFGPGVRDSLRVLVAAGRLGGK